MECVIYSFLNPSESLPNSRASRKLDQCVLFNHIQSSIEADWISFEPAGHLSSEYHHLVKVGSLRE